MTRFTLLTRLIFVVVAMLFLIVAARSQFMLMNVSGPSDGSGPGGACGAAQFDFSDGCNIIYLTGVMRP